MGGCPRSARLQRKILGFQYEVCWGVCPSFCVCTRSKESNSEYSCRGIVGSPSCPSILLRRQVCVGWSREDAICRGAARHSSRRCCRRTLRSSYETRAVGEGAVRHRSHARETPIHVNGEGASFPSANAVGRIASMSRETQDCDRCSTHSSSAATRSVAVATALLQR